MRKAALLTSLLFLAASVCLPQTSTHRSAEKLTAAIRQRLEAYGLGNAAAWAGFVDDECFCGGDTKAGIRRSIATRPAWQKTWFGEITDLKTKRYGDTVIAYYRTTEFTRLGHQTVSYQQTRTETYILKNRRWLLFAGTDNVIPNDPPIARVDPSIYDAYVGRYEYAPCIVDVVTRDGNRLMVQAAGQQEKDEVLPENEITFFSTRQDWRVFFVKGAKGPATELRFRHNGQDLIARRVN